MGMVNVMNQRKHNPLCSSLNCEFVNGEVRLATVGDGSAILCRECFEDTRQHFPGTSWAQSPLHAVAGVELAGVEELVELLDKAAQAAKLECYVELDIEGGYAGDGAPAVHINPSESGRLPLIRHVHPDLTIRLEKRGVLSIAGERETFLFVLYLYGYSDNYGQIEFYETEQSAHRNPLEAAKAAILLLVQDKIATAFDGAEDPELSVRPIEMEKAA
jgi:hypothetical protein